jgi:hypothetical protein
MSKGVKRFRKSHTQKIIKIIKNNHLIIFPTKFL